MEALRRYLLAPPSGHAILLNGPWGSGKSYQWSHFSLSLSEINREPISLSVAGLVSQEQLEAALFQASLSCLGNEAMREAATVIGRALLRTVRIEPNDIKLKSDFSSGKTVVCLDDVERFEGKFSILFGFIVNLLDRARVHCVLLADERKAMEKFGSEFGVSKERIIGRTVVVSSDTAAFSEEVIKGLADQGARDLLMHHFPYIRSLLNLSGTLNLRTIRYFLMEVASLISDIRPVEGSTVRPLLSAVYFWVLSASRNAAERDIAAAVFRMGGMAVAIQIHVNRDSPSVAGDDIAVCAARLVYDSGLMDEATTWPKSTAFATLVEGAEVDVAMIAEDFSLHAPESISKVRALQAALNGYSQMTDDELQTAIGEAKEAIKSGLDADLVELVELYRTLRHFRNLGFIAQTESDFDKDMNLAFSTYDPSVVSCDHAGLEFLSDHQGADSLPIWGVIRDLADRIEQHARVERNRSVLAQLADPSSELPDMIDCRGMFADLDPHAYAIELIAGAPVATDRLSMAIRRAYRVSNVASYLRGEAPFYEALAAELGAILTLDSPRTIAQVSVLSVRDQLSALAARVMV